MSPLIQPSLSAQPATCPWSIASSALTACQSRHRAPTRRGESLMKARRRACESSACSRANSTLDILPQLTTQGRLRCDAPRLNVALARLVDLKAALLAETRARGPDGSRMRSPQLARCSRDQLRRRMGQHGAALGRARGGGCEVFRAPPSLGRQLEARQRAGRRAASESTVVDALLATDLCLADPATPTSCGCVA